MKKRLVDEAATLAVAADLKAAIPKGAVVFLQGELGAGKTTFVRGYLRAAGYTGPVKSPTFTLVEEYRLPDRVIHHFDLYRLSHPEELEDMGIRDYLTPEAICFIEWPERGYGVLPAADITLRFEITGTERQIEIISL